MGTHALVSRGLDENAGQSVCPTGSPLVLSQSKSQPQSGVCPWLPRWVYPDTQARLTRYPQIPRSRPRVPTHVPGLAADWDESRKVPADRDTR
jgi:hypothetical protein